MTITNKVNKYGDDDDDDDNDDNGNIIYGRSQLYSSISVQC